MGVEKEVLKSGNGEDYPKKGDQVTIEYTGNLFDEEAGADNHYRGDQFDSSVGRGDFKTQIGTGRVIKGSSAVRFFVAKLTGEGWDEGVMEMSLGEKSILTISSDYAYGDRGFPGLIPAHSPLVFEVELKAINNKSA